MTALRLPAALVAATTAVLAAPAVDAEEARAPRLPRPFVLPDLEPRSSLGASGTLGMGLADGGGTRFLGELGVDGELGVGRYLKLTLAVPLVIADGGTGTGAGLGKLAVGAMALRDFGAVTGALGASLGLGGSDLGEYGALLRYDFPSYVYGGTVTSGFADLRLRTGSGFVQLHGEYAAWEYHGGEVGYGTHSLASLTLGGAHALASGGWLVADLGVSGYFAPYSSSSDDLAVVATVGLRGRPAPGAGVVWAGRLSGFFAGDGYGAVALGVELRADFLAVGMTE